MPWSKSSERTVEAYKELLGDFIPSRRKSMDLIAREQLIRGNILKYDFTKRQMIILMFLMTYSFNLCKEWAYIPKLNFFEVAGISFKKIRGELNKLIRMNVIEENKEESTFRISEPKLWKCHSNEVFDENKSRDLFLINLQHAGVDITPIKQKLIKMDDNFF